MRFSFIRMMICIVILCMVGININKKHTKEYKECLDIIRIMEDQLYLAIHSNESSVPGHLFSFNYDNVEQMDADIKNVEVTVTAYNNHKDQTDSTPNTMASGRHVYEGAIALSQDLLAEYKIKWGDVVCLQKPGLCYIVEDTMNSRYDNRVTPGSGNRADIFMFSREKALRTHYKTKLKILKWRKK